jgi:NADH:ubiquinone oxidoreductase subunit F (NADH-binding)
MKQPCATPELDVESFYALNDVDFSRARCQGTACFVARQQCPDCWRKALCQPARVYCLGKCYTAPAIGFDATRPTIVVASGQAVVLERIVNGGFRSLEAYQRCDRLAAIQKALTLPPGQVIDALDAAELRGRGGAGYPTGAKWRTAASQIGREKFIVANFDEGDPGAYIDRVIVEQDPFCLIEGMAIAAYAVGAGAWLIYARGEHPEAIRRLQQALNDARASGLLGARALGSDLTFDVEIVVGRGSYECGEETAMLNSIEERRPMPRARPPYVAERGLHGRPTVVNNVETLANIPWIIRHGADAYSALGIPGSRGTKVVSLNSLFQRPGLYEIEFGMPLREIVEDLGGGLANGTLKGVMIGGPLAGIVPPELLDVRFGFKELPVIGASVGHGGIIAFDEHTSIAELIHHVFSFGAFESCGLCTPCRLGAPRIEQLFAAMARGEKATGSARGEWRELVAALKGASACGLGTGLAEFAESIERHFAEELGSCFN